MRPQMGRLKTCASLKLSCLLRLSQERGFCEFQIMSFKQEDGHVSCVVVQAMGCLEVSGKQPHGS